MSVTVHGCVKWTENPPEIHFLDLETCLEQSACMHWTGIHAQQVALTLSGADDEDCNDTFYSNCVDFTTGRFQVSIPEDCCYSGIGNNCKFCDEGETPEYICIYFIDVTETSCGEDNTRCEIIGDINKGQGFICKQNSIDNCRWNSLDTITVRWTNYVNPDCTGEILWGPADNQQEILVIREESYIDVRICNVLIPMYGCTFYGTTENWSFCVYVNYTNRVLNTLTGPCAFSSPTYGNSGYARINELL